MSAHTPGPWQVEEGFSVVGGRRSVTEYFVRRDGDSIAIAADILDPKTGGPSEANARLIAVGPELLKAGENALPWLAMATADRGQHPQAIENAKADLLRLQLAIAKAGGNPGRGIDEAARAALAEVKP